LRAQEIGLEGWLIRAIIWAHELELRESANFAKKNPATKGTLWDMIGENIAFSLKARGRP